MGSLYLYEKKEDSTGQKEAKLRLGPAESGERQDGREYPPLRCMGKSAEVIDRKGVAKAPLRQRVRKQLEIKGIKASKEIFVASKEGEGWRDMADLREPFEVHV